MNVSCHVLFTSQGRHWCCDSPCSDTAFGVRLVQCWFGLQAFTCVFPASSRVFSFNEFNSSTVPGAQSPWVEIAEPLMLMDPYDVSLIVL